MSAPIELRQLGRALASLPYEAEREALSELDPKLLQRLVRVWQFMALPAQLRPEDAKAIWLVQAGRGFGKTRLGAEETLDVCEDWGKRGKIILASKTIGDVRKVMIKGESGLEACARRRGYALRYVASHSMVYHPSGAEMYLVTSEKPDVPRGLQCNYFWADEVSSWMSAIETFDNILFAWRLPVPSGKRRAVITTTPKPNPISFKLARAKELKDKITVTRGRTRDNAANLDDGFVEELESIFAGTRWGRQELDGELLEGMGAVVEQDTIHTHRLDCEPEMSRVVVSLDPSISHGENSDAAGIVVVGCDERRPRHAYVLADYTLDQARWSDWARKAVMACLDHGTHTIVAEVNQGGGGVAEAIQTAAAQVAQELGIDEIFIEVVPVWASKSKRSRAEPVGALYENGRVHHVGVFKDLENELTGWMPGMDSPNRMDALVHGVAHLLLSEQHSSPSLKAYFG